MDQNKIENTINLKEIASIDHPPYHKIMEEQLESDIEKFEIKGSLI